MADGASAACGYQCDYRYALAFCALALIALAVSAISVYLIIHRTTTGFTDAACFFVGWLAFLISLSLVLGNLTLNSILN